MSLHISCRRWFQRTYGNTYHSVRIFEDGRPIATLPMQYGYGEQCLQSALDWLRVNRPAPPAGTYNGNEHNPTIYIREVLGATYDIADVERRKDLHDAGAAS